MQFSVCRAAGSFDAREIQLDNPRVVVCGYTGADPEAVQAHVRELQALGVPAPDSTPLFIQVTHNLLRQAPTLVHVDSQRTSGEAEPVLIHVDGRSYLTVGSDHTDRGLETSSIAAGKAACSKVLGKQVWPLEDVEGRWGELIISSQDDSGEAHSAQLSVLRHPRDTLTLLGERVDIGADEHLVAFLGTPAGSSHAPSGAAAFVAHLRDPSVNLEIECAYDVDARTHSTIDTGS